MKTLIFSSLLLLAACAQRNDFEKFYESNNVPADSYISEGDVTIEETLDMDRAIKRWENKGYIVLGSSDIYARWVPRSLLEDMGGEKGATVVLVSGKVLKDIDRSSTVYISGRTEEIKGNLKITTYTSTPSTIDYTITMYHQTATFLAKKKK